MDQYEGRHHIQKPSYCTEGGATLPSEKLASIKDATRRRSGRRTTLTFLFTSMEMEPGARDEFPPPVLSSSSSSSSQQVPSLLLPNPSPAAAAAMKKKEKKQKQQPRQCTEPPPESPSYRLALKSLFSCRNSHGHPGGSSKRRRQLGCSSAPSICKQEEVKKKPARTDEPCKRRASVSGSTSRDRERRCVMKTKQPLSEEDTSTTTKLQRGGSSSSSSTVAAGSFRAGVQLRRLSGCYECHHMVVDPILSSSSMRAATICPCPDCGEIFVRQESLQLHQSMRHAVSELGSEDTSRNIIEIIFQSSWLKKQSPVCRVERILKVHNTARTLARFEEYRDAVKAKAKANQKQQQQQQQPRCTADGNELLRFHCVDLGCSLGLHGAAHLCGACPTCAIIRDGFFLLHNNSGSNNAGIRTMATSGRAHDAAAGTTTGKRSSRAMLVCRVIAGRVKRQQPRGVDEQEGEEGESEEEEYESVAGSAGVYSNMEELLVFNPRAILPCFVVIYKA